MKKVYEIINPSDYCTVIADDAEPGAAGIAIYNLSTGYGLRDTKTGELFVPPALFGGADEWLQKKGVDSPEWTLKNKDKIIPIWESCVYGDREDFTIAARDLKDDELIQFQRKWNERKRSSMSNISAACFALAAKLKKIPETK